MGENGEILYGNDPASRKAAAQALKEIREKNNDHGDRTVDVSKIGEVDRLGRDMEHARRPQLTKEQQIEKYGRILQKNEGKWDFKIMDDDDKVVLDVPVGKYMSTASIDIDLQPTYIIINIKGKYLQLILPDEVKPGESEAQRSKTTGNLKLVMPKVKKEEMLSAKKMGTHEFEQTSSQDNSGRGSSLQDDAIGSGGMITNIHNIISRQ